MNPFKGNKKETSGVEVMEPSEKIKMDTLSQETETNVEDLKKECTPDNFIKLTPEKRKLVIDKVKVLLSIAVAAGIVAVGVNFKALDNASDIIGPASQQAIVGGAGAMLALLSGIGLKIRDMYQKEKARF